MRVESVPEFLIDATKSDTGIHCAAADNAA